MFELEIKNTTNSKKIKGNNDNEKGQENDSNTLSLLKRIFEIITGIVDDCEISIDENGIIIQVMDSSHVTMADIFLPSTLFYNYRCDRKKVIGIKTQEFIKIFKSLRPEPEFTFKMILHDESDSFRIEYIVNDAYELKYDLTLYTFNIDFYEIQDRSYDIHCELPTDTFTLIPKVVGSYDEFITFKGENKTMTFYQKGITTSANMTLKDGDNMTIRVDKAFERTLSMKCVSNVVKAAGYSDTVGIYMSEDFPVYFRFKLPNDGFLKFLIAPKNDEDNE